MGQPSWRTWHKFPDVEPGAGEYLCAVDFGGATLERIICSYNPDEKKGDRWSENADEGGSIATDSDVKYWSELIPLPGKEQENMDIEAEPSPSTEAGTVLILTAEQKKIIAPYLDSLAAKLDEIELDTRSKVRIDRELYNLASNLCHLIITADTEQEITEWNSIWHRATEDPPFDGLFLGYVKVTNFCRKEVIEWNHELGWRIDCTLEPLKRSEVLYWTLLPGNPTTPYDVVEPKQSTTIYDTEAPKGRDENWKKTVSDLVEEGLNKLVDAIMLGMEHAADLKRGVK